MRELLDDVSPVSSWELPPGAAAGYGAQVAALFGAAARAAEVGADVGSLLEVTCCCCAPIPEKPAQVEAAHCVCVRQLASTQQPLLRDVPAA